MNAASPQLNPPHIGIAGGGICGLSVAWHLLAAGYRVTLVDRNPEPVSADAALDPNHDDWGATWTAAGMLTPNTEVDNGPEVMASGQAALALWPAFAKAVNAASDRPFTLHQGGCWVLAHRQDMSSLQRFTAQWQALSGSVTALPWQTPGEQQPALGQRFQKGVHLPDEAWVNPKAVALALKSALITKGATLIHGSHVHELQSNQLLVSDAQQAHTQALTFDAVMDCRGLGAQTALSDLRGVRGELLEIIAPEVEITSLVRLMHPRYNLYLVPRGHGHYVLGATEIESEDSGPITLRSAMELMSAVYTLHSGFADARIHRLRANCRPTLSHGEPDIHRDDIGVWRINGLYRHGILLAPLVAQQTCAHFQSFLAQTADSTTEQPIKKPIKKQETT